MEFIKESKKTAIHGEYDVIVVGGGIAGVSAALAAARNNAKVLLLEKTTVLGGLATAGHVIWYLPLCDGMGRKVFGGIPEELLYASIKYGYNDLPPQWHGKHESSQQNHMGSNSPAGPWELNTTDRYKTIFNGPAFVMALDELIKEAGIDLLLDTVFCDVHMEEGCLKAVIIENKSGRQAYLCKAAVDASGDADLLYRCGAECIEQDNHITYWAYVQTNNDEKSISPNFVKLYTMGNYCGSDLPPGLPRFLGTDGRHVTDFLLKGREMTLEKMKKDPSLVFSSFPSQAQFRTTRRLRGDSTFKTADAGKHFSDSIGCLSIWNVAEPVYEVPFGCLKTHLVKNVFAAGRIISAANGQAWEIIRPIPQCAMTGQAGGSAAAIYAKKGKTEINDLQLMLKKDGVMLTMNEKMEKQSLSWLAKWEKDDDPWFKDKEEGKIHQLRR